MQNFLRFASIGIVFTLLPACANTEEPRREFTEEVYEELKQQSPDAQLKTEFSDLFRVGAAVDSGSLETHAELLTTHFNSLTAENEMKFESLQRSEGRFNFTRADEIVDVAVANGMDVRGHALVWHRQTPSWVFRGPDGEPAERELVLQRMQDHISMVMDHFKGRVGAWDVVNEAFMNDGSLRTGDEEAEDQRSPWFESLGEDYVKDAFRMAHAGDPDAKLFYNDYYNYLPAKQEAIAELLSELLDEGVPVHGVGLQCHLNIEPSANPEHQSHAQTVENLENAIKLYQSLGLEVHITELDLSVYVAGNTYAEDDFYTAESFDRALQIKQGERYAEFFALFRKYAGTVTSVTFWGVADDNTWLSEFDSGRTDFPLLFDLEHQPKPAFFAVLDF